MVNQNTVRSYPEKDCIAFRKTNKAFGGLSNMAPGFPIELSGIQFLTAEALYQACRFPQYPDLQRDIIAQRSPITAKEVGRCYAHLTRQDWDHVRLSVMRWSLHAQLICNWEKFGSLLRATGDKGIVEDSDRDPFWSASKKVGVYTGVNVLGRLLMQLRQQYLEFTDKL